MSLKAFVYAAKLIVSFWGLDAKAMKTTGCQVIRSIGFWLVIFILLTGCAQKGERIKNARKFIGNWNYDRALTEIISYRNAKDAEVQYLLGYCYFNKNEFEEAAKYFTNSLARDTIYKDSIVNLYNRFAQNAINIDEQQRALFFYQEIAKLVPEYSQANNLFLLGDIYFAQGNYPSAAAAYRQALRIDSGSNRAKQARINLIRSLAESDSLISALALADNEYQRLKSAANLLLLTEMKFALGKKLFETGLLDSARFFFDDIVAGQEPKSFLDDAYFYLGEIYLKKNLPDAALEMYTKVLRLNPYEKGELIRKTKERINEIKELK